MAARLALRNNVYTQLAYPEQLLRDVHRITSLLQSTSTSGRYDSLHTKKFARSWADATRYKKAMNELE